MKWVEKVQTRHWNWVWILISGFGVGMLSGLSVSPVISIIINGIIGVAVATITVLSGLKPSDDSATTSWPRIQPVTPFPVAILVIGIVTGALVGVPIRTYQLLGPNIDRTVSVWVAPSPQSSGLTAEEVRRRIFESTYPIAESVTLNSTTGSANLPGLHSAPFSASNCDLLTTTTAERLPAIMVALSADEPTLSALAQVITNTQQLDKVIDILCTSGFSQ